jgi:hypothetical protein
MVATSSQRGLTVPTNLGDTNVWGPELNATINALDTILAGLLTLPSSTYGGSVTLTTSMAQCGLITTSGAATGNMTITFSSTSFALGLYSINNAFTSSYSAICTSTAGPTVTVPAGQVDEILSLNGGIISLSDGGTF